MKLARITSILGLLIMIMPYLGFPSSWKTVFYIIVGAALIYVGYSEYRTIQTQMRMRGEKTKTYAESSPEGNEEAA